VRYVLAAVIPLEPTPESPRPAPSAARHTRLIGCQGTAQLITAIAAATCKEDRAGHDWRADDNVLIIHDLYSPAAGDFERVVREMAAPLADWKDIVTIPAERLRSLKSLVSSRGAAAAIRELRALIGVDRADSLYLCRNWQFGSELLLNAYRDSEKICYGDGIGLYSGRRDQPAAGLRHVWKRTLRRAFARLRGVGRTELESVAFDVGYLAGIASPGLDDRPPMPTHVVDARWQRRVLDQLCEVDFAGLPALRHAAGGRPCLVLIGESLSESGTTTPAAEAALYCDIVRGLDPTPGTLLLYKPHPRDNPQKVRQVAAELTRVVGEVRTLNEAAVPFLPFELLFAVLFRESSIRRQVQVWTAGYTAMALQHLYGARVTYGIGDELIRRHFAPRHVASRIELERYMRRYLAQFQAAPPVAA